MQILRQSTADPSGFFVSVTGEYGHLVVGHPDGCTRIDVKMVHDGMGDVGWHWEASLRISGIPMGKTNLGPANDIEDLELRVRRWISGIKERLSVLMTNAGCCD